MPAVEGTNLGLEIINNSARSGVSHALNNNNNSNHHHHQNNNSHHYDLEHARMEAWLDEHQEFAQEYFIRKATRNVVDAWLVAHATPAALATNDMMALVSSPTHVSQQQSSASRNGSGATTPVRYVKFALDFF
jgi:dual 3',5'-cyclic-AMP and -GMP phosphodiesterase 11